MGQATSEPLNKFRGNFTDTLVITELRGDYPKDIPHFADIDIGELTKGDDDPMFLTIPIGKANVVSGNNRFYDEAWLQELERQATENRPIGIMGHLRDTDLATEFPPEAIFWIGVRRIGELLWGKGYVPPGEARERVRRYKATNKTIATSISAVADGIWDKARGALHMLAETLKLHQIDIGPSDRIGIPDLARVPLLTSEMAANDATTEPGDPSAQSILQENLMNIEELKKVQVPPQRGWTPSNAPQVAELASIREILGLDDNADLTKTVTEMRQAQIAQAQAAVKARIVEMATPDPKRPADQDHSIKQETVRAVVIEMVEAKQPQTVQDAESAYKSVVGSAAVTELLKSRVVETMGPRQGTAVAGQQGKPKYFAIPEDKEE